MRELQHAAQEVKGASLPSKTGDQSPLISSGCNPAETEKPRLVCNTARTAKREAARGDQERNAD